MRGSFFYERSQLVRCILVSSERETDCKKIEDAALAENLERKMNSTV